MRNHIHRGQLSSKPRHPWCEQSQHERQTRKQQQIPPSHPKSVASRIKIDHDEQDKVTILQLPRLQPLPNHRNLNLHSQKAARNMARSNHQDMDVVVIILNLYMVDYHTRLRTQPILVLGHKRRLHHLCHQMKSHRVQCRGRSFHLEQRLQGGRMIEGLIAMKRVVSLFLQSGLEGMFEYKSTIIKDAT